MHFLDENGHFAFLSPLWALGACTHVGKRIVDFLLVTTEHFSLGILAECYEQISIENRLF